MNDIHKVYRIVEIKGDKIMSLFHGTGGSRTFLWDIWICANNKLVSDGSSGYSYMSGFHFLWSKEEAERFFNRRFKNKENRRVVPCYVRNNIRIKNPNINPSCYLADEIMFKKDEIL